MAKCGIGQHAGGYNRLDGRPENAVYTPCLKNVLCLIFCYYGVAHSAAKKMYVCYSVNHILFEITKK